MQIAIRIGLGQRRRPLAVIVPARIPPFVWAWPTGRPRLLLPQELWTRLDLSQQNALLAHELAHLKRGDHWVRWLEAVVLGLYWWDPIAWLARRELERTEEESCDAWVIWSQPSEAGSYAEALVATTAFLSDVDRPLPLGGSGVGRTVALKRRLVMLASDVANPSLGRSRSRKVLVLAGACLPLLPALAAAKQQKSLEVLPSELPLESVDRRAGPGVWRFVRPVVRQHVDSVTLETTRLRPAGRFNLKAQVDGTSQRVRRSLERQVEKLSIPVEFDPTRLELQSCEGVLRYLRAEFRLRALEQQLASDREHGGQPRPAQLTELTEAKAALMEAMAEPDLAGFKLEATMDPAPVNGMSDRLFDTNEDFLESGAAYVLFASDYVLAADIYVEESTARRIDQARRDGGNRSAIDVRIAVRDENDFPHKGVVDLVDREITPTDHVFLHIIVPNRDGLLSPGLVARIQIQTGPPRELVLVPESSIQ